MAPRHANQIQSVVDLYKDDAPAAISNLRRFSARAPGEFNKHAGAFLLAAHERSEGEILVRILLAAGVLPPLLCDPSLYSAGEAAAVFKMAQRVEPALDTLLARWLSSRHDFEQAGEQSALRCLEILSGIADGGRIRPLLIQLLRSKNRRVRSKTALVIGSLHSNVAWFLDLIRKGDPRVAANALEGAWNAGWRGAQEVFQEGINSRHPRVAGNAIVGLSLLGEKIEALKEAERIAAGSDPRMRATAAWAMGEIGSPLSMPSLQTLARDPDGAVKRNALRALARIRNRVSAGSQPPITPADAPAVPPPS